MTMMTAADLDVAYTRLCKTMTELGESNASLFLARFALLALDRIGDVDAAQELIAAAAENITPVSDGSRLAGVANPAAVPGS